MKLIIEQTKEINEESFYIKLFRLHKSYLLLISNNPEMGIGSVYLGIPPTIEGLKPSTANYGLFGMGRELLGKIITERCSFFLKSPILLLLFLKTKKKDEDIIKPLIKTLNNLLEKVNNSESE